MCAAVALIAGAAPVAARQPLSTGEETRAGAVAVPLDPGAGVTPGQGETNEDDQQPATLAATTNGGLVVAGVDATNGLAVMELTATGALVQSFGGGIARPPIQGLTVTQVLPRPDGSVLLICQSPARNSGRFFVTGPLKVVALNADGSVDGQFGAGGVATLAGMAGTATILGPTPASESAGAALQGDGDIVLAGTTTSAVGAVPKGEFVVAALGAGGSPDKSFATDGIADGGAGIGIEAVTLADGSIDALGTTDATGASSSAHGILLALTAAGVREAQFAGGSRVVTAEPPAPGRAAGCAQWRAGPPGRNRRCGAVHAHRHPRQRVRQRGRGENGRGQRAGLRLSGVAREAARWRPADAQRGTVRPADGVCADERRRS